MSVEHYTSLIQDNYDLYEEKEFTFTKYLPVKNNPFDLSKLQQLLYEVTLKFSSKLIHLVGDRKKKSKKSKSNAAVDL